MSDHRRFLARKLAVDLRAYTPEPDHPIDCIWSPDQVAGRLIEAVQVIHRHGGRVGPRGYTPAWGMEIAAETLELGEKVAMHQDGELRAYEERLARERNRYLMGASQQDMSRAEEAMLWPARYLAPYEGALRVVRVYIVCRAMRRRFGASCKRRGWARATAYRLRDRGLCLIALGLTRDLIRVLPAAETYDDDDAE